MSDDEDERESPFCTCGEANGIVTCDNCGGIIGD